MRTEEHVFFKDMRTREHVFFKDMRTREHVSSVVDKVLLSITKKQEARYCLPVPPFYCN